MLVLLVSHRNVWSTVGSPVEHGTFQQSFACGLSKHVDLVYFVLPYLFRLFGQHHG